MLRLRAIRYAGCLAACLLVLTGWLGGALPGGDAAATPASVGRGPYGLIILGGWLVGTVTLAWAWWAAKDRVPSVRWATVTIVMWVLPFVFVPPMGSRDVYSYACQGHLFLNGVSPYEAGVGTLPCPWLDAVSPIWRDTPAPYGPLFVLIAAATVALGGSLTVSLVLMRLLALVGVVTVAACLPVLAHRCGVPVQRALWVALAGPLVGLHLVGGPHNDALLIALVIAGLTVLVVGSRRPIGQLGAGVLLGAAVAIKVTALVVLPFALLLAVRRPYRRVAAARDAGRVAAAAAGVMFVATTVSGLGVGWVAAMSHTRDLVQFTSPPTAVGMTVTYVGRTVVPGFDAVPAVRVLALAILAACLVVLWVRSALADGDHVRAALHGAGLACAATIALAPSFHPWYAMLPLVLLASATVRTGLVMAASVAAALLVLPDGSGLARFVKFPGALLVTILLVVLLVQWWRRRNGSVGLAHVRWVTRVPASTPAEDTVTAGGVRRSSIRHGLATDR